MSCVFLLTTPPTTMMPMEVREVSEARPVTMETISSSWVMELWGNGGILVLTGVRAIGRGTCMVTQHWLHLTTCGPSEEQGRVN